MIRLNKKNKTFYFSYSAQVLLLHTLEITGSDKLVEQFK